jgi:UDP-N-acetylmuramoyl-tripeptide--D-alanyl-D-alanine ligase
MELTELVAFLSPPYDDLPTWAVTYIPMILAFIGFGLFGWRRMLRFLHIFQQEEYDNRRFAHWWAEKWAVDKRLTAGLILVQAMILATDWTIHGMVVAAALALVAAALDPDPRLTDHTKKPLHMTDRARRIARIAMIFYLATLALPVLFVDLPILWVIPVQLVPFTIIGANLTLSPREKKIRRFYRDEAVEKLDDLRPTIIGITGSFGKTSVKHILGHVLGAHSPTLMTPGSVNTEMGITRIIREELTPEHQYFIVEMGAYGPGSIARLCDLTPPTAGILTAIGPAHYERFKSLEAVAKTKYELAEAVIENDGPMVVHASTVGYPAVEKFNPQNLIIVGDDPRAEVDITNIDQTADGVIARCKYHGDEYDLYAPLYGRHHGHNMALAFTLCMHLGLDPETVITALASTPQITHRLQVKRMADQTIYIDDAYNSNPKGFTAALELMGQLADAQPANVDGQKICITPGMVELGEKHGAEHFRLGKLAGETCDFIAIVQVERIPTFLEGVKETADQDTVWQCFDTFETANQWIQSIMHPGDIILIENDLPDLYERHLVI